MTADMIKFKKTIRRRYSDFYTADDLFEAKGPLTNFSIADLDAKGHLVSPKAPCVVTTIDPKYTEYTNRRENFRKFNVKSDILRLREITRKKFLLYVTQQRAIEKAREQQFQTMVYEEIKQFLDVASQQLNTIESESFRDMLTENDKLKDLQCVDLSSELKQCVQMHQKLSVEVKDIHKEFIFLLKLIGYFDVNEEMINILKLIRLADAGDYIFLKENMLPSGITADEIKHFKQFLADVIEPYLTNRKYLNADVWIAGYESTRRKLFDYYNQFTKLALLNHTVSIVHEKFMKSQNNMASKRIIHNDPSYLKDRKNHLQTAATDVLKQFEEKQSKCKIYWKVQGVAPVMLEQIQDKDIKEKQNDEMSAIEQLEQVHTILMCVLNELDTLDPNFSKLIEEEVRRHVRGEKKASRKVLIKVNRLHNWIEHYKRHLLVQKNPKN